MKSTTRCTVTGPFAACELGGGLWQLTTGRPGVPEIFLRGAGTDAELLLRGASIPALGLEWRADGVAITWSAAGGMRRAVVQSALVHEPKPALYQSLPLADFDADAKRFWKRIFRLMRLPGGRLLLKFVGRSKRGQRGGRARAAGT
jgi:hypothetical protein